MVVPTSLKPEEWCQQKSPGRADSDRGQPSGEADKEREEMKRGQKGSGIYTTNKKPVQEFLS